MKRQNIILKGRIVRIYKEDNDSSILNIDVDNKEEPVFTFWTSEIPRKYLKVNQKVFLKISD